MLGLAAIKVGRKAGLSPRTASATAEIGSKMLPVRKSGPPICPEDNGMNIGEAAERSGVPPKTIRYYEEIGLLQAAARDQNGYRDYDLREVTKLRFLKRARASGFLVEDCRELLSLFDHSARSSADVKAVAHPRIAEVKRKIGELASLKRALLHLIEGCERGSRPDFPVLEDRMGPADPSGSVQQDCSSHSPRKRKSRAG